MHTKERIINEDKSETAQMDNVKAGLLQLQTKFELDTLKNMTDAMIRGNPKTKF